MEKKKNNDKRSSSARCAPKRTMQICFAVITMLLLSVSMVTPAFAYAIDDSDREKAATILSGTVTYTVSPTSDDVSNTVSVSHSIGGLLPMPSGTGEYYGQDFEDYLLSLTNDPDWSLTTEYRLSRTARSISNFSFASYGYNVRTLEASDEGQTRIPYQNIEYRFNPYMFYENYDESVFKWMFRLKLNRPCEVKTRVVYTVPMANMVGFYSILVEDTYISNASPSALDAYHPFEKASQDIAKLVLKGGSVLISEMSVTVTPTTVQNIISTGFELLGSNWIVGTPAFVPVDDQLNYDPLRYTITNYERYLADVYNDINLPEPPETDPPNANDFAGWTVWLGEVVGGFFGVEIFPGFSFGAIFAVMASFVIMWLLLKLFAGG